MPPIGIRFRKLSSMHDEPVYATSTFFNVQPRFNVVLPNKPR
jgi:hypothetical protein